MDLYLRSLAVALLAGVGLMATRRASASVRHLVALTGLVGVLAVPILGIALPPVQIPVLPVPVEAITVQTTVPRLAKETSVAAPMPVEALEDPEPVSPWPFVWGLGSLLLLTRWSLGLLWLRARLRDAKPVEGLDVPWPVVESEFATTPFVTWTPRATVVLPLEWRDWSAERLAVVLRHEEGHLRRGDGWHLLLSRLALAAAWPNPLVWWLACAEARLAERATDDLVVGGGIPAWLYATELLAIVREPRPTGSLPALGMAQKVQVAHRVEMILKPEVPRNVASRSSRRGALLTAMALAVPAATCAFAPQESLPQAPATSAKPVVMQDPEEIFQVQLNCKLVRTEKFKAASKFGVPSEPQIGQNLPGRVVTAPKVRTRNKMEATIGVDFSDGFVKTTMSPERRPDGMFDLTLSVSESLDAKKEQKHHPKVFTLRSGEWVRYPLTSPKGEFKGYQMLVQLVAIAPE